MFGSCFEKNCLETRAYTGNTAGGEDLIDFDFVKAKCKIFLAKFLARYIHARLE